MEEQQNKNYPVASGKSINHKAEEEKELLKEAQILVRNQEGRYEYLKGISLLGKEAEIVPKPVQKPSYKLPSFLDKEAIKQVTASQVRSPILDLKEPTDKLNASFYFDAEDEEEIRKIHAKKIGKVTPVISYENIVQEIKKATGVDFSDELLQKRFSSLITSRLKDIRTSFQLKELLIRSKKVGGLELSEEKAEEVVKITEEKAKAIHDQKTIKELEEREKKKAEEERTEQQEQQKLRQAVAREQIKKALQAMQQKTAPPPPPPPQPPIRKKERVVFSPVIPQVKRPAQDIQRKPRMVDIKTPSKLLGPVEEIRSLSLVDFHRLSSTPYEAVKKIKEKIDLLEEESFTKKTDAIQAWKQSEIYQLYLDIGNESMNKGESVKEIIESRTREGRSYLTEEEFKAVGDLNKELRF